jgi:N6-L-threonylcarbamoyladenine synthase
MKILAIETSCDETAAAVAQGRGNNLEIISNIVSSQIKIHKKYGGVVPEVAAREHVLNIIPVIDQALTTAGLNKKNAKHELSAIAVTAGPGLITSLMIGLETAKTLSYVWKLPIISVNHIEGHLYSNFIDRERTKFPAIILTVSGGHTQLVLMKNHLSYKTIGETRDDAAGEAFDKAAQLLGLGYPGGPLISKQAEKFKGKASIQLPRPMMDSKNYEFSFSGLKTALLYMVQKDKNYKKRIPEYAYAFQEAVVDVLVAKTIRAAKQYKAKTVMLAGGVAANKRLRERLSEEVKKLKLDFRMPEIKYTTDNAAMIASAGYFKFKAKKTTPWRKLKVDPNLEL